MVRGDAGRGVVGGPVLVGDLDHAGPPRHAASSRATGSPATAKVIPCGGGPRRPRRGQGHERVQRRPPGCGASTSRPSAPDRWTTTVPGRARPPAATSAMAASGVAMTRTSTPRAAPARSSWRPRSRRTSQPASASAAASDVPARPGPISRTVAPDPFCAPAPHGCRSLQAIGDSTLQSTHHRRPRHQPLSCPDGTRSGASSASGCDHEPPLPHAGMGDHEVLLVDLPPVDQEDVDVQGARAPAHLAHPAGGRLEARQPRGAPGAESVSRARPRGSGTGPGRGAPHRLGLVQRRHADHVAGGAALDGRPEVGPAVTEVGAEPEEGPHGGGTGPAPGSAGAPDPHPGRADVERQRRAQLAHGHRDRLDARVGDSSTLAMAAGQGLEQPDGGPATTPAAASTARRSRRCRPGRRSRAGAMSRQAEVDLEGLGPLRSSGSTPWTPSTRRPRTSMRSAHCGRGRRAGDAAPSPGHASPAPGAPMGWPIRRSTTAMACGPVARRPDHSR